MLLVLVIKQLIMRQSFNRDYLTGGLPQTVFKTLLSVWEVWGSNPGSLKLNTVSPIARHRCDYSSQLCYPGAKPRRWAPPLITRLSVIMRL